MLFDDHGYYNGFGFRNAGSNPRKLGFRRRTSFFGQGTCPPLADATEVVEREAAANESTLRGSQQRGRC